MGEHSLLLQDGGEHKRARKLLMPAFNGHALRGYEALVTEVARAEVGRWRRARRSASLDRMNALTLEVILRVVFGVTDEEPARPSCGRGSTRPSTSAPRCCSAGATRGCSGSVPGSAPSRTSIELDRLIYAEIRERRRAPDLAERTDVLSRLIRDGRGDRRRARPTTELRDQLVTLLLAGHETTATALAWALYELGRDPRLLRPGPRGRARPATTPGWTRCSRSRCGCTRSSRWWCAP